jgi:hypothetical protein
MATVYSQLYANNRIKDAERKQQVELNEQLRVQKMEEEARNNVSFWEKLGVTIADVFTELGGGLLKLVEGVADAGVSIAGVVGGLLAQTQNGQKISLNLMQRKSGIMALLKMSLQRTLISTMLLLLKMLSEELVNNFLQLQQLHLLLLRVVHLWLLFHTLLAQQLRVQVVEVLKRA